MPRVWDVQPPECLHRSVWIVDREGAGFSVRLATGVTDSCAHLVGWGHTEREAIDDARRMLAALALELEIRGR